MEKHQFERLLHEIVELRARTDGLAEGQQKLAERTEHRFERLLHEIVELREHTDEGLRDLREHTDEGLRDLREHTDEGLRDLREHTDGGLRGLREEVRSWVDDARRHFQVLAEDLRSDIRLLAEGLVAVNERLDRVEARLETRMNEGFAETYTLIRLSYRDLDRRVSTLEGSAPS